MKKIYYFWIGILHVVLIGFNPIIIYASTYYVDYAFGSDSRLGTSYSEAWKHCPGDLNATDNPASVRLVGGDSVIFKGGITYIGEIRLLQSGSSSSRITYDGNSSGSWGVGKAIISGDNRYLYGFTGSGGSFITINNFEVKYQIKYGIYNSARSSYVTVSNCYIHNLGYWNNDGSFRISGMGIFGVGPTSWIVAGNEITKTGEAGISLNGAVNCIIESNNIHDYVRWGIDIGSDYARPTGNVIRENTIHDLYMYDVGFYGGTDDPPHTDFIFIRSLTSDRPVNNIIERNLFYNNYAFTNYGGTAMIFAQPGDNTTIRNNVFINAHNYYVIELTAGSVGTKIYNNTIYTPRSTPIYLIASGLDTAIYNNIAVGANFFVAVGDSESLASIVGSNNNMFKQNGSGYAVAKMITPYTIFTLSAWNNLAKDTNSVGVTTIEDIRFVRTSGYPTACQTMDLRLSSTSPAVNRGLTINSITNDKNGISRPQGSFIDIGAYEFIGSIAPTTPTTPMVPSNILIR